MSSDFWLRDTCHSRQQNLCVYTCGPFLPGRLHYTKPELGSTNHPIILGWCRRQSLLRIQTSCLCCVCIQLRLEAVMLRQIKFSVYNPLQFHPWKVNQICFFFKVCCFSEKTAEFLLKSNARKRSHAFLTDSVATDWNLPLNRMFPPSPTNTTRVSPGRCWPSFLPFSGSSWFPQLLFVIWCTVVCA